MVFRKQKMESSNIHNNFYHLIRAGFLQLKTDFTFLIGENIGQRLENVVALVNNLQ